MFAVSVVYELNKHSAFSNSLFYYIEGRVIASKVNFSVTSCTS